MKYNLVNWLEEFKMGGCIEGQKQDITVDTKLKITKKRRISSIEDVLDPKACRGGPTERKTTLIRRNFIKNVAS